MSSQEKILSELNSRLDKELSKNESFLEKIGRYCAKQRGVFTDKAYAKVTALTGTGALLISVGSIMAQLEGIINQSPSNQFFALGCMALSGAVVVASATHHLLTAKMLDPILSDINFQNFKPEKVGKIFSGLVANRLIDNENLTSEQKYEVFDSFESKFVEKVSCHYNQQYHMKDFPSTIKGMELKEIIHNVRMSLFQNESKKDLKELIEKAKEMVSKKENVETKIKGGFDFGM